MNNIMNFPSQDLNIEIERTEEFYKVAKTVGDYIKALPLNNADNDRLITLILEQIKTAEQGAFNQGFTMGVEFSKYAEKS